MEVSVGLNNETLILFGVCPNSIWRVLVVKHISKRHHARCLVSLHELKAKCSRIGKSYCIVKFFSWKLFEIRNLSTELIISIQNFLLLLYNGLLKRATSQLLHLYISEQKRRLIHSSWKQVDEFHKILLLWIFSPFLHEIDAQWQVLEPLHLILINVTPDHSFMDLLTQGWFHCYFIR